jgi:hypothetical protein
MTTPRDPDELASALLDGLLSDDEAAAARRDPAVVARLVELAAVREAVGTPPPPPDPASRERSLAAALAAFDAADGGDETGDPAAVAPMTRTRAARSADTSWRASDPGRRGRWLTAAAVILVVVGLGFLARDLGSDGDSESAETLSAGDESSTEAGTPGSAEVEEGAGTGGQAEEAAEPVDLGDVGSPDALADRARAWLREESDGAETELSGDDAPADQGAAVDEEFARACESGADPNEGALAPVAGTVVLEGRATLDGRSVDVWVVDVGGAQRLVAVAADCTVVVDQPLEN